MSHKNKEAKSSESRVYRGARMSENTVPYLLSRLELSENIVVSESLSFLSNGKLAILRKILYGKKKK
jgi:hypothetical protein